MYVHMYIRCNVFIEKAFENNFSFFFLTHNSHNLFPLKHRIKPHFRKKKKMEKKDERLDLRKKKRKKNATEKKSK